MLPAPDRGRYPRTARNRMWDRLMPGSRGRHPGCPAVADRPSTRMSGTGMMDPAIQKRRYWSAPSASKPAPVRYDHYDRIRPDRIQRPRREAMPVQSVIGCRRQTGPRRQTAARPTIDTYPVRRQQPTAAPVSIDTDSGAASELFSSSYGYFALKIRFHSHSIPSV